MAKDGTFRIVFPCENILSQECSTGKHDDCAGNAIIDRPAKDGTGNPIYDADEFVERDMSSVDFTPTTQPQRRQRMMKTIVHCTCTKCNHPEG